MGLTERQRRVVRSLGDTMFPKLLDGDVAGGDVLPTALESILPLVDPAKQKQLLLALAIFEYGAVLRHAKPFSSLGDEARARYVDGWRRSRFDFRRVVYRSLVGLFTQLYYDDPRVWTSLGYDGPVVRRAA